MPLFWSEKYTNSKQKHVFTDLLVIIEGSWPGCGQSRISFTKISQNYEYFQIILEQFVDEFNQKWSPNGVIFAEKAKILPAAGTSPSDPRLPPADGGSALMT